MIVTLIPAAGQSSRMGGRDKLLETIDDEPILARTARIALEAGLGQVVVTLRPDDQARRDALCNQSVTMLEVETADEGMSASLRVGADAALKLISARKDEGNEYSGMMVVLPDMPEITSDDCKTLNTAFQASGGPCLRATDTNGRLGHPAIFPTHVLRDFEMLSGDKGAAALLAVESLETVCLGDRACLDLDTSDDWAAWRARTGIET